ncbi:cellulose binding domain-containing protein [Glycomyces sp. NPDC047010]|uniref:cellulose binding domain-containing protein n=1 Tax=Glycomyces sp. NPDC047010 TaxID=3155023 RepID=UPI0033F288D6
MASMPTRPRRLAAAVALSAAVAAATLGIVTAGPAHAVGCQALDYKVVSDWGSGHQAAVSLTAADGAVDGWEIGFQLKPGAQVQSAWNVSWSQSGTAFTGSDVGWNAAVGAGQTRELFGLVVSGSGAVPAAFSLNGVECGTVEQPTDTPSEDPTDEPTDDPTDPPTDPEPGDCPAGAVCDGFEDQAGTVPGGAWSVGAQDCTGTGTATVDTAVSNGGGKSVRVNGGATYCNHVFVGRALPADAEWFRVYMRHSTAQPPNHTTMIAMQDRNDANGDLRLGGQNSMLQWNRESDDATLPAQSPAGVALSAPFPVDTWVCVEYRISGGNLATWVDGEAVTGLTVDGVPTHDVDEQWLSKSGWNPDLADLRLGWESYGNDADTVWYDDVAFGPSRIGC